MDREDRLTPEKRLTALPQYSADKFNNSMIDLAKHHQLGLPAKKFSTGTFRKQHSYQKNDRKLSIFNKTIRNMRVVQEEESGTVNSRSSKAQPTV